jgi:DNA-binding transcriptional ArsR family regulator
MNFTALRDKAKQAERFLKAMANDRRLMILCELHKGEIAVTPLQQKLKLGQASLSQHLARLRLDGLVKTRRESQTIYYSLASDDVARAIELIYEIFCGGAPAKRSPRKARRKATTRPATK